jgi:hypothetical protein
MRLNGTPRRACLPRGAVAAALRQIDARRFRPQPSRRMPITRARIAHLPRFHHALEAVSPFSTKLVQRWPRRAASLGPCSAAPSPPPSPPASRYEAPSACPRNLPALRGLASFFRRACVLTLRLDGLLACSALLKPDGAQAPRGRRQRQLPPPGLLLLLLRVPGQRPARQASSGSRRYGRWLCLAGGCPVSPGARRAGGGSRGLWTVAARGGLAPCPDAPVRCCLSACCAPRLCINAFAD